MTKKNFLTLLLGVAGGLVFALGMCMCLIPEWQSFRLGVVTAVIGAVVLLVLLIVRRRMDGKKPAKPNWKLIGKIAYGVAASLVLGTGMCMVMIWQMMLPGVLLGVVGIVMLVCLVPMCMGFKEER